MVNHQYDSVYLYIFNFYISVTLTFSSYLSLPFSVLHGWEDTSYVSGPSLAPASMWAAPL